MAMVAISIPCNPPSTSSVGPGRAPRTMPIGMPTSRPSIPVAMISSPRTASPADALAVPICIGSIPRPSGVVAMHDALLHDEPDVPQGRRVTQGIPVDGDHIRELAFSERPQRVLHAQQLGSTTSERL